MLGDFSRGALCFFPVFEQANWFPSRGKITRLKHFFHLIGVGADVVGGPCVSVSVVALGFILDSCDAGSDTFCVIDFEAEVEEIEKKVTEKIGCGEKVPDNRVICRLIFEVI